MGYRTLHTLTEPRWERQEGETPDAYARFKLYRDQVDDGRDPHERSLREVSERLRIHPQSLRQLAKAQRWDERATAFDDHQEQRRRDQHERRAMQFADALAEEQLQAAREAVHAVRMSLHGVITAGEPLRPEDTARIADSAVKLGQAATKAPDQMRAVYRAATATANSSDPAGQVQIVEASMPEFAGLSPDAVRQRVSELVGSLDRLDHYEKREQQQQELGGAHGDVG